MPRVFLVAAASLCGHISGFRPSREDRAFLETLRDRTAASLMGAGTLRKGNPEMRGTGGRLDERRIRALVSLSGDIFFQEKKIFQEDPLPLIFAPKDKVPFLQEKAGDRADIIGIGFYQGALDLREAVQMLKKRGAESVLVEGGGVLNAHALNQNIIHEIFLTLCPRVIKNMEKERLIAMDPNSHGIVAWDLVDARAGIFSEIFLHYRRTGPDKNSVRKKSPSEPDKDKKPLWP